MKRVRICYIDRLDSDTLFGVSLIKAALAGTANWYRFRWKVKACIDRVQKEQAALETQDWARFDCALDSALSTVY